MTGRARKEEGMDRAAGNNQTWLQMVREQAIEVSRTKGEVWIDDLRRWADKEDCEPDKFCDGCNAGSCSLVHQNAWGCVFRGPGWVWTGEYRKSEYASNHARDVKVWVYAGENPQTETRSDQQAVPNDLMVWNRKMGSNST